MKIRGATPGKIVSVGMQMALADIYGAELNL